MTPLFDVILVLRKIPKWEGRPIGDFDQGNGSEAHEWSWACMKSGPTILDKKYLLVFVNVLSGLVEAYSIGTDYSNSY